MDSRLKTDPAPCPLNGLAGTSRSCGSGEVEGVVDFREEEVVLVRSLEDEAAEADNWSDCFLDEDGEETEGDLSFRDVVIEMEGAVESCRWEATLVSVAPEWEIRLAGSAASRVFGRRGDLEVSVIGRLVAFSTSFWGSSLVSARGA